MTREEGTKEILSILVDEMILDTDTLIENLLKNNEIAGKLFDDCSKQNEVVTRETLSQYIGGLKIDFWDAQDSDPDFNYDECEWMDWVENIVVSE
jgi:hypothetical protein